MIDGNEMSDWQNGKNPSSGRVKRSGTKYRGTICHQEQEPTDECLVLVHSLEIEWVSPPAMPDTR